MIRSLRNRHRIMTLILAIVLPVLWIGSLLTRQPAPVTDAFPAYLGKPLPPVERIVMEQAWPASQTPSMNLKVLAANGEHDRLVLELQAEAPVKQPDLLLYWQAGPTAPDQPGETAFLLGALAGNETGRFLLPVSASQEPGQLFLYSLAHQKVLTANALDLPGARGEEP